MLWTYPDLPASSRASPLAQRPGRVVLVSVLRRPLPLPEHALNAGLCDLQLATEEYVPLENYTAGVAQDPGVLAKWTWYPSAKHTKLNVKIGEPLHGYFKAFRLPHQ